MGINPFLSHRKYWDESLGTVPLKVGFELTGNSLFRADEKPLERLQSAPLNLPSSVEHLLDLTDHDLSSNATIKQAIVSNRSLVVASPRTRVPGTHGGQVEVLDVVSPPLVQRWHSGILATCGVREIRIASYPEGHPRIARDALERAFDDTD